MAKPIQQPERPRLAISFSGGRTSAVMLKLCLNKYSATHDILITFANTGCEDLATLDFVDAVDQHFADNKVIWIEAEIHGEGKGPTSRIVDYKTASRSGEPFEAAIAKHGVFCKSNPSCTTRLKVEPMEHYIRKVVGWHHSTYLTAIGIRSDEIDRVSTKAHKYGFIYPLVTEGWRKQDVNKYMAQFDWDLKILNDAYGNCRWCWKKSQRKLMTLANDDVSIFDFPDRMEKLYGHINKSVDWNERRVFFRGKLSAQDIIAAARTTQFRPYEDDTFDQLEMFEPDLDTGSACGESCEIGADD